MDEDIPEFNDLRPRPYQVEAYRKALRSNLLLILPTGLGKTLVSAMLAYTYIKQNKKVIMISPTRPLVDQHFQTMTKLFEGQNIKIRSLTGHDPVDKRMSEWAEGQFIISTPQTVEKDIKREIVFMNNFYLLIVDEAHRATGNYAYVNVAKEFHNLPDRRILAMTASPGSKNEKVDEIKENLKINSVMIRTDEDPDIAPYVKGSDTEPVFIRISPEQEKCISLLRETKKDFMDQIQKKFSYVKKGASRSEMSEYIRDLSKRATSGDKSLFTSIPYFTAVIRLDVLMEYIETQGIEIGNNYLQEMESSEDKSLIRTLNLWKRNSTFQQVETLIKTASENYENPKFKKVKEMAELLIKEHPESRCLVFTHYRKTSEILLKYLEENSATIRAIRFVGQGNREGDKGMSQSSQREGIDKFKNGTYNVMLATSVAEEGLDIPSTDLVIFYEPVASEIRTIQRRGRTGRFKAGKVYILIFSGTRDQAYYYSSQRKEKVMVTRMKKDMDSKRNRKIDEY
ncbi:DEAD/DEAH box helicase [Cuniculiplasma divulgatum]|jgi:Fanconi anemia group M protein|uniref:ERCC4-like helicase n=1 Tax=Cuniculiplasma divulgatum TaxID=1673428 RepID=A0A1N5WFH2_9ARCH|nr:DEAD/DEAH box helicase [Cuniculiplasma divulgatum]SIM83210.1 ERCC4-like helicase [Cuniculiplasma divulgatum]